MTVKLHASCSECYSFCRVESTFESTHSFVLRHSSLSTPVDGICIASNVVLLVAAVVLALILMIVNPFSAKLAFGALVQVGVLGTHQALLDREVLVLLLLYVHRLLLIRGVVICSSDVVQNFLAVFFRKTFAV